MRVLIETVTGRKGIKNFSTFGEYVNFLTENSEKIMTVEEVGLPYVKKDIKLTDVTTSDGWTQLNADAVSCMTKDKEKGDCLLPSKQKSAFKDEAKFQPSQSSEKADKSSESKVAKESDDLPKFEYKDEDKCEDKKDCEKKEVKESVEDELDEGIKDSLKKAGKFARNTMAAGAVAAGLMGGAHNANANMDDYMKDLSPAEIQMLQRGEDPYSDNEPSAEELNADREAIRQEAEAAKQEFDKANLKEKTADGKYIDKWGRDWTEEEWEMLRNGEDPLSDNEPSAEELESMRAEMNETLRIAGVKLDESDSKELPREESLNEPEDGKQDEKSGNKKLFEDNKDYADVENSYADRYKFKIGQKFKDIYTDTVDEVIGYAYSKYLQKKAYKMANQHGLEYYTTEWRLEAYYTPVEEPTDDNEWDGEQELLDETKPARYNQHLGKDKSFANISASRSNDEFEKPGFEKDKQQQSAENNKKTEQLKKDIKDMGLSYIKTYGAWKDEGPVTQENSFLIPNITKEQALELGKKYGQYSVIFKDKGDETAYMYITLDNEDFGKPDMAFDMSKNAKFSQVKKGKDELEPYSGWTGLKKGGKGYNLSYNEKK